MRAIAIRTYKRLIGRDRGQTLIEYAMILALFSVALIGAAQFFQGGLSGFFDMLGKAVDSWVS